MFLFIWETIRKNIFNTSHRIEKLNVDFNDNITASSNIEDFSNFNYLVYAVPTQSIRKSLEENIKYFKKDVNIICVSKGIELGTGKEFQKFLQNILILIGFQY